MAIRLPWLTGVDRTLLDWLEKHNIVFTPRILHDNLRRDLTEPEVPSYSQVSRRIRLLAAAGLLDQYDDERGKYNLSELGSEYLEGDIPDDERERLATLDPDDLLDD